MDVTIAIGYDGCARPDEFRAQVRSVIERLGTLNAEISGASSSPRWGTEDATWFATTFTGTDFTEAYQRILAIGAAHNQEAVAFTIGATDVAECPRDSIQRRYRDFL